MAKEELYALTKEQLVELLTAVRTGAPVTVREEKLTEEELMVEHLRRQGIYRDADPRALKKEWRVACFNENNGARFTARIVESRKFAAGLVVDLLEYTYPEDIESRFKGPKEWVQLFRDNPRKKPNPFLDWRRDNFYMADMKMYVSGGTYEGNAKFLPVCGEKIPHTFKDAPEPEAS